MLVTFSRNLAPGELSPRGVARAVRKQPTVSLAFITHKTVDGYQRHYMGMGISSFKLLIDLFPTSDLLRGPDMLQHVHLLGLSSYFIFLIRTLEAR